MFRSSFFGGENSEIKETPTPSSKLGLHISDTISKRVITLVIVLIVVMPYLQNSSTTDSVVDFGHVIAALEIIPSINGTEGLMQNIFFTLMNSTASLVYIEVNRDFMYRDLNVDIIHNYRSSELIQRDTDSLNSTVIVTVKDTVQLEAGKGNSNLLHNHSRLHTYSLIIHDFHRISHSACLRSCDTLCSR